MRFDDKVVMFDFAGIPLVGCLSTGYVIGLSEQGAAVCARMFEEDVPEQDVSAVDPALLEHLVRGGFFDRPLQDDKVASAYLHVTQRCNLACAGCYSLDAQRNALADAPLDDVLHAVDELAQAGAARVIVSGGEPFLREDLPDIAAHAKRAGIANVTVLSNGTCISDAALERLAPHVDCVSVSFDGCSADAPAPIRGAQRFEELADAVRRVRKAGIPAHIIPTAHAKNVGELPEYVRLAEDLGASLNFSLLSCEPEGELASLLPGEEELRALGRSLLTLGGGKPLSAMDAPVGVNLTVRNGCGAGFRTLSVAADGTVYPCHMLHRPEFAMGNAFTGLLADALRSKVSRMFRDLDVQEYEGCSSCRYMRICGGGCRARSLFESGNLKSKDSYCLMTQTFYDTLGQAMAASIKQRR
ncbi:radical SAM protein [Rubneribacter sp.]